MNDVPAGHAQAQCLPQYRRGSLCDVMPSIAATLGAAGFTDIFNLPRARRVCLLLVDGLGQLMLQHWLPRLDDVPTLSALFTDARQITAGFPSTTAVSLTSLATGLPPGEHGMLGYRMRVPGTAKIMHSLRWDKEVDPLVWQSRRTVFEMLAEQGIEGRYVASGAFRHSGLTRAAWRGAGFLAAEAVGDVVATMITAAQSLQRGLVYAYHAELDHTGHLRGWGSPAWRYQLGIVDTMIRQLIAGLPSGTVLIVTGDHGMIDVPAANRVDIDVDDPAFDAAAPGAGVAPPAPAIAKQLSSGVALFSGEDRVRYLHTMPGAHGDVLAAWRETFRDQAWIVSREEAIDAGWFGPRFEPAFEARIGDVVVASGPQLAVQGSVREPRPFLPVALHGSLTAGEQLVPLLVTECA